MKLARLPLSSFGTNYATFEKDSFYVKLTVGKFIKANHKIRYIETYAVKIDDKPIWGKDGDLPTSEIKSIVVRIGKDTIPIPRSAYQELYEPSLAWKDSGKTAGGLSVYYSKDRRRIYIAMSNSEGAGFYEATSIISNKKYAGRIPDNGF
ncbi:hypothetical protein BH11BAC4_BH11BAC4_17410 [soil metagenome]